jgi:hypothetical protein
MRRSDEGEPNGARRAGQADEGAKLESFPAPAAGRYISGAAPVLLTNLAACAESARMSSWIESAEAALRSSASPPADTEVEVLRAEPPPLVDVEGVRAIMAPFLAAFMWAATIFREVQSGNALDPLALLLRLLALAMTVRALTLLWMLGRRLRLRLRYSRYALALTPEGILYRTPDMDLALPREDILEVRERGKWRDRGGRRFADVYVITQPRSGRLYVALPPLFERTPGVLAERLMRWLGPPPDASDADAEPAEGAASQPSAADSTEAGAHPLASELWERVARGERPTGVTAIPHGRGWLQRGPYASMLLGLAVLEGYLRLPPATRERIDATVPLVLVGALVIVPVGWLLLTRSQLKVRRGLAGILTPTELLLRTRSGLLRVAWPVVQRADIESRAAWSLLLGAHEARTLAIRRKAALPLQYQESFVGVPLEVLAALCDAYRRSRIVP